MRQVYSNNTVSQVSGRWFYHVFLKIALLDPGLDPKSDLKPTHYTALKPTWGGWKWMQLFQRHSGEVF